MAQTPIIRDADDRNGKIAAVVYILTVLGMLFFITYTEPDPPKVTIPIPIVMEGDGIEDFEIDNGGGGTPNEATDDNVPVEDQPKEQPVQQEESPIKVPTGKGKTETTKPTTPAPDPKPNNPFGGTGTGGQGSSGTGTGFGNDDGPGTGTGNPGKGMSGDRIRLTDVTSTPKTPNDQFDDIAFKLIVDSRGVVIKVDFIRNQSTTTNQRLIDEVAELVKKEVKYKEKPGAGDEITYLTVKVKPN